MLYYLLTYLHIYVWQLQKYLINAVFIEKVTVTVLNCSPNYKISAHVFCKSNEIYDPVFGVIVGKKLNFNSHF